MKKPTPNYQRHRFPSDILSHAVWLFHRFCLSFREVEELLAERGITVTYETVRQWSYGQKTPAASQEYNFNSPSSLSERESIKYLMGFKVRPPVEILVTDSSFFRPGRKGVSAKFPLYRRV